MTKTLPSCCNSTYKKNTITRVAPTCNCGLAWVYKIDGPQKKLPDDFPLLPTVDSCKSYIDSLIGKDLKN